MSAARLAIVVLLFGLFGDQGADHGRTGNTLFEQGQYAAAESAYRDGLAAHDDTTGTVYASLQNNLGAALHRQKEFAEARTAFQRAIRAASTEKVRRRALFNSGTAAAGLGQLRDALSDYKDVLLLDPTHQQARYNYEVLKGQLAIHPGEVGCQIQVSTDNVFARYNYEVLKRQLAKNQPAPSRSPDVEPSAFARRLKRKADMLVSKNEYQAAAELMSDGLRKDSTVAAYRDFMGRLTDVAQIAETP